MTYWIHRQTMILQMQARIVLLPTVYGLPRFYNQCFQNAMTIVRRKFGKPDLFITFTCNPKWEEITGALHEDE